MSTTFTLTHVGADGQYRPPETVGYAIKELNKQTFISDPIKGYFNESTFQFSVPTEKANDVEQFLNTLNPKFLSSPKFTFTKSSKGGYRKHRKHRKSRKSRNSRKTRRN